MCFALTPCVLAGTHIAPSSPAPHLTEHHGRLRSEHHPSHQGGLACRVRERSCDRALLLLLLTLILLPLLLLLLLLLLSCGRALLLLLLTLILLLRPPLAILLHETTTAHVASLSGTPYGTADATPYGGGTANLKP